MATLLKKIYIYTYIEPEPRCKLKIWKTDVLNFILDRGQSAKTLVLHTQKKTRKRYEYLLVLMKGNFTTF